MSIVSIAAAERERYVQHFEASLANLRSRNAQCARELLISIDNEALPYPYRYVRVDAIETLNGARDTLYEFWLDPAADAEARGFQLGPVTVEIYPFTWCAAQIAFDRPPDTNKLEALLTGWLHVEDENSAGEGPAKAIHSASPVETNGELWYLTIDFGTAPADVFLDLLDFHGNEGADRIIILSQPKEG